MANGFDYILRGRLYFYIGLKEWPFIDSYLRAIKQPELTPSFLESFFPTTQAFK